MEQTIIEMFNSLEDGYYISFVCANENYNFTLRKGDTFRFIDDKTLVTHRESGRTTIINLNLIIGICITKEWI